ncbi:MAG: hypothetical protein HY689_15365 [Chloroflexi bacterium]|nr:hypothetical protein [Chloroflexota bacterium]
MAVLRWLLPIFAIAVLLWGVSVQFLPAVPLAVIAIVVWLFLLPRPRVG